KRQSKSEKNVYNVVMETHEDHTYNTLTETQGELNTYNNLPENPMEEHIYN
ncbi:hypothetical protein BgiBS90_026244, partial [Biomphalaria glabrata]